MSIPMSTTTITVTRASGAPYETGTATAVAAGVRAVISAPSGADVLHGGTQEIVDATLTCDTVDVQPTDAIVCAETGQAYEVVWARKRVGFGLDHVVAGLRAVAGVA